MFIVGQYRGLLVKMEKTLFIIITVLATQGRIVYSQDQNSILKLPNLDRQCMRCLCHVATECDLTKGCDKGYCGPYKISRIYWKDAKEVTLPEDDKERAGGIIQKLDYIQDTGINAIWLSPIYKSPQVDNGYDISDYRDVDPIYGTLDDLRQLVDEAHSRDIKVIMDYVSDYTSDQHKWFQASVKRESGYEDFYIWKDPVIVDGERTPPNNWLSHFKGSAWEWNEERQQYYLHQFSTAQPDLNFRNPDVVSEMKDILRYWINFGVDGFRMDAVPHLFEDSEYRDEPLSGDPNAGPEDYGYLNHIYTSDLNETIEMIYQFREVLDEFNGQNNTNSTIVMMTEVYSAYNTTMLYYGTPDGSRLGAHFTFNFWTFITGLEKGFSAFDLVDSIDNWTTYMPSIYTPNWVLGNHDQPRVSTRLGAENIDALNILLSLLPGVQVTYNGEEIGQENGQVTCEQGYDPQAIKNCSTFNETSRDFERTPIQWDTTANAGFNDGAEPWLPVSQDYLKTNLADQIPDTVNSHYNIYKELLQLRSDFRNDTGFDYSLAAGKNLFLFGRNLNDTNYTYMFNVGDDEYPFNNISFIPGKVIIRSGNSNYKLGDSFNANQPLQPREAVIFKDEDSYLPISIKSII